MRTATLVLVVLLAASGLALLAPPAEAWAVCDRVRDEDCPGTFCLAQGNRIDGREDCRVFVP